NTSREVSDLLTIPTRRSSDLVELAAMRGDLVDPLRRMIGKPVGANAADDDGELGLGHGELLHGNLWCVTLSYHEGVRHGQAQARDRKSTRLNSSHVANTHAGS